MFPIQYQNFCKLKHKLFFFNVHWLLVFFEWINPFLHTNNISKQCRMDSFFNAFTCGVYPFLCLLFLVKINKYYFESLISKYY